MEEQVAANQNADGIHGQESFAQLHHVCRLGPFLHWNSLLRVTYALVNYGFDYCINAFYMGCTRSCQGHPQKEKLYYWTHSEFLPCLPPSQPCTPVALMADTRVTASRAKPLPISGFIMHCSF